MKPLITILSLFFILNSYSSEPLCFKRICLEDEVVDEFGYGGIVSGFNLENEEVLVSLSHTPSTFLFPYSVLGIRTKCIRGICEEDRVIDPYNEIGRIVKLYDNGTTYFLDEQLQSIFIYNITRLTPVETKMRDNR